MLPSIKTRISADEFYIDEGGFITEVSNSADDPDLSIALARIFHNKAGANPAYAI